MTGDLIALAERVERASGADRYLDACISAAVRLDKVPAWAKKWAGEWVAYDDGLVVMCQADGTEGPNFRSAKWTASLDAAMSLVPEGWGWLVSQPNAKALASGLMKERTPVLGEVQYGCDHRYAVAAATPALALVSAALRARAQESGHG